MNSLAVFLFLYMFNNGPIGIFDSGIGGTSIWKEIHQLMPQENCLYLADSANAPYGKKSKTAITQLCLKNTDFLLEQGAKIIVVACNTATTNAIDYLRKNYKVPFIGIEPAIKPAALKTKTKSIGILATQGTLSSTLFAKTSEEFTRDIQLTEVVGTGLVELLEAGSPAKRDLISLLTKYMAPMIQANIDYLVLGCSHYPYLLPYLKELLPENVTIIDSGDAVARQTKQILSSLNLLTNSQTATQTFCTNTNPEVLEFYLEEFKDTAVIKCCQF